jgi:hypothetical protein
LRLLFILIAIGPNTPRNKMAIATQIRTTG